MRHDPAIGCAGMQRDFSRRGFVGLGMLGLAGLSLADLLRLEASAATGDSSGPSSRTKSVIILWMRGGPSQLETWDPKPDAPVEIRGEFGTIGTNVPGIRLSEYLPRSAQIMDKWSIVRSMHFRAADGRTDHSSGDQVCFTGYPAGPVPDQNIFPSLGSIAKRQLQQLNPQLPAYVMIPRNVPGTDCGYLGPAWAPFETQADPANSGAFRVPNLAPEIPRERIDARRSLLSDLDRLGRRAEGGSMRAIDEFHQQAAEMITGTAAQAAFNLDSEPESIRQRYGFYEPYRSRVRAGGDAPNWPQRMLLARRLVEAGVRLVTVDCRWWDTHEDNFWSLKNGFLPRWDQAYSALIEDLDQRGLLESTLVVAWGEMGRTPKVNAAAGRDHWPQVFSAAVAGGGVRGGRVVGASDKHAAYPKDNPKIVQDMLATIYRHVGVNTQTKYYDFAGRPHPVLPCGEPIGELFS